MRQTFKISTSSFATQEEGLLSITNNSPNIEDTIEIRNLDVKPFYYTTLKVATTGVTSNIISSFKLLLMKYLGNEVIEVDPIDRIIPVKNNTSSPDLPSQIIISKHASIRKTVALNDSLFRLRVLKPYVKYNGSGFISIAGQYGNSSSQNSNTIDTYFNVVGNSSITSPIRIKPNQSFTILPFDTTRGTSTSFYLNMTFKVQSGGTFTICEEFSLVQDSQISNTLRFSGFILHNGINSGINIDIIKLELTSMGTTDVLSTGSPFADQPYVRFVKTNNTINGGQTVNAIPYNTNNQLPPLLVSIKRNRIGQNLTFQPASKESGFNAYADFSFPNVANINTILTTRFGTLRRTLPMYLNGSITSNHLGIPHIDKNNTGGLSFKKNQLDPIILRKGESIVIALGVNTPHAKYQIEGDIVYATIESQDEIFTTSQI